MNYVIEATMPDGPHWYGGVKSVEKGGHVISGILWTPYKEDREIMNNELATIVFNTVCSNTKGVKIVTLQEASDKDARIILGRDTYEMRAKYLQPGMRLTIPGHGVTEYTVEYRDDKQITLYAHGDKNRKTFLGINSDKRVRVTEQEVKK
jgi:hypothetical protein